MSQHGRRSLLLVDGVVVVTWSGPRRSPGTGPIGAACDGNGTRVGLGGGSSGAFKGPFNGAFNEMFRVDGAVDGSAANASRSGERAGVAALGALDAPTRIAPRIARTCVAHDWVASPRIARERVASGRVPATGGRSSRRS
jgi:hypothetical protein